MLAKEKFQEIKPQEITKLLKVHYCSLMASFYEAQTLFLSKIYKRYKGLETANIIGCFQKNLHLTILRQREKNLNYDVSLDRYWYNIQKVSKPIEKISSIVTITGIPKETTRRKIKNLMNLGYLSKEKYTKGYSINFVQKHKDQFYKIADEEIAILSKFTYRFAKYLKLKLNIKTIENEIKSQFSFYMYHFLNYELQWLKMWQTKFKDCDLLLIVLQAVIPTLQYADKNTENLNTDNLFKIIGKIDGKYNLAEVSVSAAAISGITGIPRATCIRKLEKLVSTGFLFREQKTKRYLVNQNTSDRTKNVITKESVDFTISSFSTLLSIILNSLIISNK